MDYDGTLDESVTLPAPRDKRRWRNPGLFLAIVTMLVMVGNYYQVSAEAFRSSLQLERQGSSTLFMDTATPLYLTVSGPHGEPLSGGKIHVQFWGDDGSTPTRDNQDHWESIATEDIAYGAAVIELPPNPDLIRENREQATLHLRIEVDPGFLKPTAYFTTHFDITHAEDDGTLALNLDRPIYQPGQTILMRGLAISHISGQPLGDREVHWQIYDPQDNLVFDHQARTSLAGVSTAGFQLSERGVQGDYLIRLSFGEAETEQIATVTPYRLPRFRVAVEADQQRINPGDTFNWRVHAEYIHGEPLAGDVDLEIQWQEYRGARHEQVTQRLNQKGESTGAWPVPEEIKPGTALSITAQVATDAGRMEEDTLILPVQMVGPQIEFLPHRRPTFVADTENRGIAVVTDSDGRPLASEEVSLKIGDEKLSAITDDAGRAEIIWTPRGAGSSPASAWLASTPMSTQTISVDILPLQSQPLIEGVPALGRVGTALTVELRAHEKPKQLILEKRGHLVDHKILPPSQEPYTVVFKPGEAAQGLLTLRTYRGITRDSSSAELVAHIRPKELDRLPIWIRQAGPPSITMATDADHYAPRQRATLDLHFPTDRSQSVFFGVVGVDEAIYALAERAELPLMLMLQEDPRTLERHLPLLSGFDEADELGQALKSVRFFRAQMSLPTAPTGTDDNRLQKGQLLAPAETTERPLIKALTLYLLLLLLMAFLYRTWKHTMWAFIHRGDGEDHLIAHTLLLGGWTVVLTMTAALSQSAAIAIFYVLLMLFPLLGLVCAVHHLTDSDDKVLEQPALPDLAWWGNYLGALTILGVFGVLKLQGTGAILSNEFVELLVILVVVMAAPATLLMTPIVWGLSFLRRQRWISAWLSFCLFLIPLALLVLAILLPAAEELFAETHNEVSAISIGGSHYGGGQGSTSPGFGAGSRPVEVAASAATMVVAEEAPDSAPTERPGEADAQSPGARGGTDEGATLRSYFPETMVWMPEVEGDEEGRATASFLVPDSMTTWRLTAYAHTTDGRFGHGETQIQVTRDLFVEMELPTNLTDGDRLDLPITVVNHSDDAAAITVDVDAQGALSVGSMAWSAIAVDGHSRQVLTAPITAEGVGFGTLTVSAYAPSGERLDGERRHTRVAPHGRTITETYSGQIGRGLRQGLTVPGDAIADTTALEVKLLSGPNAELQAGLEGMLRQPHGCFEQTSSINYPNLQLLALLEATAPGDWPGGRDVWAQARDDARQYLHLGYQRLLTFEDTGGGFGLYPNRRAEIMLTAYGLLQLGAMRDYQTVDPQMLRRNARWLIRQQGRDGLWSADDHRRYGQSPEILDAQTTALAIMGLLAAGEDRQSRAMARAVDALVQLTVTMDAAYPRVLAANALIAAGEASRARRLLNGLAIASDGDGRFLNAQGPTWMGGRGDQPTIEGTALYVVAADQLGMSAELDEMLDFLLANGSPWGGWGSTQSTVWTLKALQHRAGDSSRTELALRYDGAPLTQVASGSQEGRHQGILSIDPGPGRIYSFLAEHLPHGSGTLAIDTTAHTSTRYQAHLEYALPWSHRSSSDQTQLNLSLHPASRALSPTQLTSVTARLKNRSQRRYDTLIIELPVAPGAFVPRQHLQEAADEGLIGYFEVLPTHIRLYIEAIEAGQTFEFPYQFIPLISGEVTLPPLRAYEFYTPLPRHAIDGQGLVIR